MTGFEQASTAALLVIRGNLLRGLDEVAASLEDNSFHIVGVKGEASPSQSGQTTLALLAGVDAELLERDGRSGHID
jgi:hypothetical protein